jgi:hypothetical protein
MSRDEAIAPVLEAQAAATGLRWLITGSPAAKKSNILRFVPEPYSIGFRATSAISSRRLRATYPVHLSQEGHVRRREPRIERIADTLAT